MIVIRGALDRRGRRAGRGWGARAGRILDGSQMEGRRHKYSFTEGSLAWDNGVIASVIAATGRFASARAGSRAGAVSTVASVPPRLRGARPMQGVHLAGVTSPLR